LADKQQRWLDCETVALDKALDETVGTGFQQGVLAAARAIPRGQMRTYGQVARRVGLPGAARAVDQAIAHNPWAIVVSCHRPVGHDLRPTGFRGDLDVKRALLLLERAPIGRQI
jgi:O-6-methylguanine DNA methyltransferase